MNPDIQIESLLASAQRPLLSYEFFPPKGEAGLVTLRATVERLRVAEPDFVTVTYGAGGSTRQRTLEVCGLLRGAGMAPVMPHLTCVGSSREELAAIADEIHGLGYRNIMTLRGDPPRGETEFVPHPEGLPYARDLVQLLKAHRPEFCCGVAGYPETHPEAASPQADIEHLKGKVDAGAAFITTQLFFDNELFYRYVDRCRAAGIELPILPGLLPAMSLGQAHRLASMCGSVLPPALEAELARHDDDPDAAAAAGIGWTVDQIEGLLDFGVPGIHLYVLNQARAAVAPAIMECFGRAS